jgi:hypothetical protein
MWRYRVGLALITVLWCCRTVHGASCAQGVAALQNNKAFLSVFNQYYQVSARLQF